MTTHHDGCAEESAHPFLFDLDVPDRVAIAGPGVVTDPTLLPDTRCERAFWRHVIRSSGCWYWVGAISSPDGYGRITFQRGRRQRSVSAHRFAVMIAGLDNNHDDGWVGEHTCNEPLCVRVDDNHVGVGTQASNMKYAVALGRHQGPVPTSGWTRIDRSRAVRAFLLTGGHPESVREQFDRPTDEHQFRLF